MRFADRLRSAVTALKGRDPARVHHDNVTFGGLWTTAVDAQPDQAALDQADELNPVAYAAVQRICEDATQPPLQLGRVTNGDFKPLDGHRALDVLAEPNQAQTGIVVSQQAYADLIHEGNFFAIQRLLGREPQALFRARPREIQIGSNYPQPITEYRWKPPGGTWESYPPEQVMHIAGRNPNSIYRGLGATNRLRDMLALQRQMDRWKLNQFFNGIPIEFIFQTTEALTTEADVRRIREHLEDVFVDRRNSGRRFAIVGQGWDVKPLPRAGEADVGWLPLYEFLVGIASMVYGVPPNKLGKWSETSGLSSNADHQERLYWEDTILGWHRIMLAGLNRWLWSSWPETKGRRMEFRYDYSGVRALKMSLREQAEAYGGLVDKAVVTRNEARRAMGLEPSKEPDADKLMYGNRPLGAEPEPTLLPGVAAAGGPSELPPKPEPKAAEGPPARPALRLIVAKIDARDVIDDNDEKRRLADIVDRQIARMVREAGEAALDIAGLVGAFDQTSPEVLDFVRRQVLRLVESVVPTTIETVRLAIAEALEAGAPIASTEVREAIQAGFLERRAAWQLDRIARTEVHHAQEGAGFIALVQTGIEMKRWLTARDSRVRGLEDNDHADHDALEALGAIPIQATFDDPRSGAHLRYPGDQDRAVSGADTINCRCALIADFGETPSARAAALDILAGRGYTLKTEFAIDPDGAWYAKDAQRGRFESSMRRLVAMHNRAMERRALERYDELTQSRAVSSV